jgi:hypothetical protein
LYWELLGEDADSRKQQALLLLAEAGFKFAGTAKPTMGMALADAMSGIPAGMSALAAQKAEREAKVKASALSQAVEDIGAEDTAYRAQQLEMLKGLNRVRLESAKQAGGDVVKNAGVGLRQVETKNGSFVSQYIDPDDPIVKRALESSYTLTPNNPFVTVTGPSPQSLIGSEKERTAAATRISALEDGLALVENIKNQLTGAYGPGAWLSDFNNNVLVPITPLNPNVKDAARFKSIDAGLNRLMVLLATADAEGRPSVFLQEESKKILPRGAGAFFQDAEVNAGRLNALHAMLLNRRQEVMAQLGFVGQNTLMDTPPTGTKNDPFVIPADEERRENMYGFLRGTVGKVTDPKARVYLQMPDGVTRVFPASEIRKLGVQ